MHHRQGRCALSRVLAFILAVAFGFAGIQLTGHAAPPPPRPGQPHGDLFSCGSSTCDAFNPITKQIRFSKTVSWRYQVVTGCKTTGATERAVRATMSAEAGKVQVKAIEVPLGGVDMTVYGSCGISFANKCGGPPVVGCLGSGYPYIDDVDLDVGQMDYWAFDVSRLAVVIHEVIGHAWGSFDEQYCKGTEASGSCAGQAQFSPAPAWVDVMNTGPDSRHPLGDIELERWSRVMYDVITVAQPQCLKVGFDPCSGRWFQVDGWSWSPGDSHWWNPAGEDEMGACNADGLRWDSLIARWVIPGQNTGFNPRTSVWGTVPGC